MLFFYLTLIDDEEEKSKFEKLYYEYRHLMKHIAFDILKDEKLAEDAVHNAFIKISRHLNKIDEISCHKTRSFIVIVIESVSKDMYRRRKKMPRYFLTKVQSLMFPQIFLSAPSALKT